MCFGTSTFVAGRLCPDKDSRPGIAALHAALDAGVRVIHSNPKLQTQWAIRRVLDETDHRAGIRHLVKAEAPLDGGPVALARNVAVAVETSQQRLGVERLDTVVLEIDRKRTERIELLVDGSAVRDFFSHGVELVRGHAVGQTYAYCHTAAQIAAAVTVPSVAGVAAQHHRGAPWASGCLAGVAAADLPFVGMSPLNRGTLVDYAAAHPSGRLAALTWAIADPRVTMVAITMSSAAHLREVVDVVGNSAAVTDGA